MIEDINRTDLEEVSGMDALRFATEISKVKDLSFHIAFYPYSRSRGTANNVLTTKRNCKARAQLPEDRFETGSENYFLFEDENGKPQTCYRYLIRYMAFPQDNYKMRKINWL